MTNGETQLEPNRGPLYLRSLLKLVIVMFIAFEFLHIHPFISLVVIWAAYFTMPSKYSDDQPWRMIEAWFRLFFAALIALMLWAILAGRMEILMNPFNIIVPSILLPFLLADWLAGNPAIALFWLALGFFFVLPEREERKGLFEVKLDILGKGGRAIAGLGISLAQNMFFLICVLFACASGVISWFAGAFQPVFILILGLGTLMGWFARGEGRPYIGIMVVGMALLAFSFQFTGTVGTAMFGAWWPTVEHYGSMIAAPMGAAFEQASAGMSDAWMMISCPSCYWQQQQIKQQVSTGTVTTGGTVKSIEMVNFEAINYETATPEIDPRIPLIGSIEIENQGEFTASGINVTLNTPKIKNPQEVSAANPEKGIYNITTDKCKFTVCTGGEMYGTIQTLTNLQADTITVIKDGKETETPVNNVQVGDKIIIKPGIPITNIFVNSCKWQKDVYPGDTKLLFFQCPATANEWSGTGEYDINKCLCHYCTELNEDGSCKKWNDSPDPSYGCEDSSGCKGAAIDGKTASLYYEYGSWWLTIGFDYSFAYDANVSLPIEVMNQTLFLTKLLNKDITLKPITSEYTGGPVKVSLWTQKQPLRDEETTYGRMSFTNEREGLVTNATMKLYLPKENLINFAIISQSSLKKNCQEIDGEFGQRPYKIVECKLDKTGGLAQNEFATVMFSYVYNIDDTVEKKSFILVGDVAYNYTTTEEKEFPIMKAPLGQ